MDHRKILRNQILASHHGNLSAVFIGQISGYGLQLIWPHIIGRSVDQVAGEKLALNNRLELLRVDSGRAYQLGLGRGTRCVARELVFAECETQGEVLCCLRGLIQNLKYCRRQARYICYCPEAIAAAGGGVAEPNGQHNR